MLDYITKNKKQLVCYFDKSQNGIFKLKIGFKINLIR